MRVRLRVRVRVRVRPRSYTLQVLSMEPEMQSSAEKSNCVLEISPRWPESVCRHRPLEVSQTFVEWSKEPVMILLPSVLKFSETISAVCLLRARAGV